MSKTSTIKPSAEEVKVLAHWSVVYFANLNMRLPKLK
jgi:hypothetical protein